jgi:hypothetical protein
MMEWSRLRIKIKTPESKNREQKAENKQKNPETWDAEG